MIQCAGCGKIHQGLAATELPEGWDALHVSGSGWSFYCAGCIVAGLMESERAARALPRREEWRIPDAIMAFYRPAAGEVLLAVPGGQAVLPENDARRIAQAITGALATGALARDMAAEKAK